MPERAVLVADGVFLHRPELRERWHLWADVVVDNTDPGAPVVLRRGRRAPVVDHRRR